LGRAPSLAALPVRLAVLALALAGLSGVGEGAGRLRPGLPRHLSRAPGRKRRGRLQSDAPRFERRVAPFVAVDSDNSVPTFGNEADTAERERAEASLKAYLRARARRDWAGVCQGLAAPTRKRYVELGASAKAVAPRCAQVLATLSKGTDLSDPLTGALLSLRVHGDNSFALFYGPGRQAYMMPMNREGGSWRPTQLGPIAYPPGAGE
jgi:hypothetical protein